MGPPDLPGLGVGLTMLSSGPPNGSHSDLYQCLLHQGHRLGELEGLPTPLGPSCTHTNTHTRACMYSQPVRSGSPDPSFLEGLDWNRDQKSPEARRGPEQPPPPPPPAAPVYEAA